MALEAIVPYFSTSRRSSAESSDSGYNSGFQSDSGNKQFYEDSPKQDDEYAQDYDSIFSDNFQRDPILVDRPGNPLSTIFNGSRQKYSYLTPSSVSIASGSTSSSSFDNENTVQSFDTMTSTASFSNVDMQASSPISLTTETSGFLSGELALPHHIVSSWTKNDDHCGTRVVHLRSSGESTFASSYGDVSMIEPEGVSIISDIDDTIKDTQILAGAKKVLSNTFFRRAKAVHGMAETYMEWYHNGASFHYVSNSPFQLTTMLEEFLKDANFPPGSMHLRLDGSLLARLVEVPGRAKRDAIIALLKDFPRRKFVLIGDSGEIDLEIYARIAADFPGRILKVMIRDVSTPQTLVRRRTTWGSIFSPSKQQHQQEIPPQQQRSASDSALLPTCDALDQRLEKARRLCPHTEMIVFQNANVLKNDSVVREALWRALDQQRPHAPL
ncbi:hypothetical protein BCR43DRAFT_434608 [Syncephalastrum racemosum]|uniref:Phosphatidate phosphatase APP1 catalytic domain-containing protein n=1 Tax=Syncephalastrum racemosum TaxID=13706 RepID=A0A1X2HLZ6_SYNRA|nr:hypothetical protein BCR43DRAFT_434608 [Syncephalastrum racemosum]